MKLIFLSFCVLFSVGLFAQVPSYVPQYGLLGYYPFTGSANDVSANAANLTNNNAVLTADRFGTANAAYSFNGINQYLINSTPNFTFNPSSSFTISFWYNRNNTTANGVLIMNATNAAGNFIWIFQAGPTNSQYGTNKQQSSWIWAQTASTTSAWTHIVCVYNAGAMTLYKNNVQVATGTYTHTNVTSANLPLYVGRGIGGDYYNGKMDDIGIWNRALTVCEINDLYNSSNSLTGVSAGQDISSCNNQAITLNGSGAINYFWNQNVTNGVPFTPTSNGTYLVTGFNANGCSQWDETNVSIGQLSINAGQDLSVCQGDTVTLNATGAQNYTWNNAISNNVPFVVNQSGTFIATGVNGTCTDTDTLQINVLPLPQIIAGNDTVLCAGGLVTLNASGGQNYTWNNGIQNAVPFTANNSETYIVTGMSNDGCYGTDTLILSVGTLPNISAGSDQVICQGDSVVLSANGGSSYQWSNGAVNSTAFFPTQTITLGVTGFSGAGCSNTDSINITVNNPSQSTMNANGIDVYTLNGIDYTTSGTFTQVIPNSVGCDSTITLVLSMEYTGISEWHFQQLNVYPNPTNGELNIVVPNALIGQTAKIIDISGKEIASTVLSGALIILPLGNLSNGTYFISIDQKSCVPIRVIKE
jgi:hypothetical protein